MKKRRFVRQSKADTLFDCLVFLYVSALFILFFYPLYFVVIASVSDAWAVWNGEVILFPKRPNLDGYRVILEYRDIWTGYGNTLLYTLVGVMINLFVTVTAAYALAQKRFRPRGALMKLYMFTMFFSGGLIPTYLLVKNLRMLDSIWALVLPGAASVTNIIITRTFFQSSIPEELWEAASLDGCSDLCFLMQVVLPLSKAIIAVIALYYGVGHWNSFFGAMVYLSSRAKYPLQLIMREILLLSQSLQESGADMEAIARQMQLGEIIKYGVIIFSSLPPLLIYPFIQKYFVKGVMIGAIKG